MKPKWADYSASKRRSSNRWASTDRGWFYGADGFTRGHYLDYGPEHYRSPHEYCRGRCDCRESQPGNVHAVRFARVDEHSTCGHESRYFPTVAEARAWIEAPTLAEAVAS